MDSGHAKPPLFSLAPAAAAASTNVCQLPGLRLCEDADVIFLDQVQVDKYALADTATCDQVMLEGSGWIKVDDDGFAAVVRATSEADGSSNSPDVRLTHNLFDKVLHVDVNGEQLVSWMGANVFIGCHADEVQRMQLLPHIV